MSSIRTLGIVSRHELRVLATDHSLTLVVGLLVLLIGYAFHNGLIETQGRDDMVTTVLKAESDVAQANLDSLRRIMAGQLEPGPFDNPENPAVVGNGSGRHTVIHSLALAPVAIGQADMVPNYYRISTRSKVEFMYDSEIESPWNLLSGHFDLSFVIVFLLPLLIFALTFNLLSGEREAGTQRMLLSQPLSLGTLVLGKLVPRAVLVLVVASVLPVVLLLTLRPEARSAAQVLPLVGWIGLVLAYGAFWFALAFAVNTLRLSSWANALILIATWTVLVLIVPVLLNLVVERLHPAPSRTELSIRTRAIKAENLRQYDDLFSGDFRYIEEPDSLLAKDGRIEIPPRTRASFLARRDMDVALDQLLAAFDRSMTAQQAAVDRLSFVSPAILVYEGITSLAGTDGRRYLLFRQETSKFHDAWRRHFEPLILDGIAMTPDDLEALPSWPANPLLVPAQGGQVWRILLVLIAAGLIAFAGAHRLKSYPIA